jgi:adenylate cyclase
MVANFRPEFTAAWLGASYYRSLPLAPLAGEAADELLAAMLGTDASLTPLVLLIVERTGGNPFFVEEVVRDLVESGTLAGAPGAYRLSLPVTEIHVPRSVHATLAARIDRLPHEERRVLQTAAVIGRTFSSKILAAVNASEVDDALGALCARELLQATDPGGYRFWHPLTQEVAAGTLLADRRSTIHAAVARALIDAEPDRHAENAALIATHWEAAGDAWEAAQWHAQAADYAYHYDMAESMRRWRMTLSQLETIEQDDALHLGIVARSWLVRFGARTGMDDHELTELLNESKSLAHRLGDPRALVQSTYPAGSAFLWRGRMAEALDEYSRAQTAADSAGEHELSAVMLFGQAIVRCFTGPVRTGLDQADRALQHTGGDPNFGASGVGFGLLGAVLVCQAYLLGLSGDKAAGRQALEEAIRLLRERSDVDWLGWGLTAHCFLAETRDQFEAALSYATEALHIADNSANPTNRVMALRAQGVSLDGLGRFDEAAAALTQGLSEARTWKAGLFEEPVLLASLALAHLGGGRLAEAAAAADEAVAVSRRQGAAVVESHAHLVRARIERASGAPAEQVASAAAAGLDLVAQTGATVYAADLRELA